MGLPRFLGVSTGIFGLQMALLVTGCSGADELQAGQPSAVAEPAASEVGVSLQATTNTPPVTPTTCEGLIQAVGATASSVETGTNLVASKAIDSDMGTRWSSQFSDPQWLKIDLGSVRAIKKVVLTWQNSYSKDYDLQVSNTGADGSWTTVYTQPAGDGGTDEVDNLTASGRYLRMYSRQRKTQFGNSLYDVKVYENTCPCQGKIQPVSATASSIEGSNWVASKAIDGNFSTRWSSQFSDPQWLSMDFGATKQFKRVVLHWETAASKKYDLQVSANGTTWTTVYTNNTGVAGTWDIPNLSASGRYLRVYSRARTTSYGVSLWEVETFQDTCTNPCANVVIDDGNVCTTDSCNSTTGVVSHTPVAAGTACADGNLCNGNETCNAAGTCTAGTAPVVNDNNPCTADSCGATTGVVHTPVAAGTACADGNLCNGNETCNAAGTCTAGTAPVVDDANPCTADSCAPATGVAHTPVAAGTACADGNLCNGNETCNATGTCTAGTAPNADDLNPCTVDSCSPTLGVIHVPAPAATSCDDATVCNGRESCNGSGSCLAGTPLNANDGNPCTADSCDPILGVVHSDVPVGTACGDNDVCNGIEACNGLGSCVQGPAPTVDDGNACTDDQCNPTFGVVHTLAPNGTPCSDDTVCNGEETCFVGACVTSTPPPAVDDANPCTTDECDPVIGTVHTPVAAGSSCDDGDVCNGVSTCDESAACIAGSAPIVDDGNVCTSDSCDPFLGVSHTPVAVGSSCDDGDVCNGVSTCDESAACVAGLAPIVDDGNVCTSDSCDPLLGVSHTALAAGSSCDDGDVCNGVSTCDESAACVAGSAPIVDDGNVCTDDSCDPFLGVSHTPVANGSSCSDDTVCNGDEACFDGACVLSTPAPELDDSNPCTEDECDPSIGAIHTPVAPGSDCEDGNVCNGTSACNDAALCVTVLGADIDDGNPCTADTCDPVSGFSHTPVAAGTSCGEANACSSSAICDATGHCLAGSVLPIDDGNPCTADACDPVTGVSHTPIAVGTSCADSNACNGIETCNAAGSCVAGTALPIDDSNPCTADACDPQTSTVSHTPVAVGTSCADSNQCNGTETCNAVGSCVAGTPPTVNDNNDCTIDSCNPAVGVIHTPTSSGSACGDADLCNGQEACNGAGACVTFVPGPVINDGNPCTNDVCVPSTGVVNHPRLPTGASCSDGNVCNGAETCSSTAVCRVLFPSGAPPPVGTSCSDGNACNGAELCAAGGICSPGTPITTDDFNPCTTDSCNPANAVVSHTPVPSGTACADGDVCNGDELCDANGTCVPGTPVVLVDDGNACTVEMCDPVLGPLTLPCNNPSQTSAKQAFDSNAALYTGENPIQTGVAPGTIIPEQAALVHGIVRDSQGNALHSVNVHVVNHPEFGATRTQSDGTLEMAVNGGGLLTLEFSQFGFLTVHRQVEVQENSHAVVADVTMIEPDSAITTLTLDQGADLQVAVSGLSTLLVPSTTLATLQLPDGSFESLSTLNVRLTQYPVVDGNLSALPADLPAAGAYTYAFEVNADEAVNSGGSIELSEPATLYVDNFLGFAAGVSVPLDYYNSSAFEWASEDSGVVIAILTISDGLAHIDADGDGLADSAALLASLGISDDELAALATLYTAGQTLWRVQLTHFSSLACTWADAAP